MNETLKRTLVGMVIAAAALAACEGTTPDDPEPPPPFTTAPSTTTTTETVTDTVTTVPATTTPPTTTLLRTVVTRVVDGDTVDVALVGRVRLIGIDTPEVYGGAECYGAEASARMKALVEGRDVIVEYDDSQGRYDKWDRVLAYLFVEQGGDRANVGEVMVAEGFAEEYLFRYPYRYRAEFVVAEMRAQAAHVGLWGAC